MRNSKYKETTVRLLVYFLFVYIKYNDLYSKTPILSLWILIDLIISIGFKTYRNRLLLKGKAILIKQKESKWVPPLKSLSLVVFISLFVFILLGIFIWEDNPYSLSMKLLIPSYVIFTFYWLSPDRGDFYFDAEGIVQPEVFKKNYNWNEIDNFNLTDDSVGFMVKSQTYLFKIPNEVSQRIKDLKE